MTLDSLLDDVLLLVLGFLDARALLRCRGVCRRLRVMALHPHLWRRINVSSRGGVQLCAAVLRLVPCLGSLTLSNPYPYKDAPEYLRLGPPLVTTNCAISNLQVYVPPQSAVFLAMALARQAALGRLTSLTLALESKKMTPELRLLLDQVLHTPGLTSLEVHSNTNKELDPLEFTLPNAARGDVVPASLRRFEMSFEDSTLPLYLMWHADTLEEVEFFFNVPDGTAALLGSLPQLQELKCFTMDNMPALLQCPALRTLYLYLSSEDTLTQLSGAHELLSQAAHRLESLTLHYDDDGLDILTKVRPVDNLVLSLAGPGSSAPPAALRSLRLAYLNDDASEPQPQLLPLASVLHRLEHLVTLDLSGAPTPHFLEAMDGYVLPRLERLRVYLVGRVMQGCCPHEWAHGAELRDLLRRYRRLHLEVEPSHGECYDCDNAGCDACKCNFCDENSCHHFESIVHTLFTHPEQEVCNQKHDKVAVRIEL